MYLAAIADAQPQVSQNSAQVGQAESYFDDYGQRTVRVVGPHRS
jgi:hypothetical protein